MRHLLLLISVLLLGACWAVAQDTTNPTSPDPSQTSPTSASSSQTGATTASGATAVEGCLSGASGNYTLTDKNGVAYQLTGDTAKLSEHVGHEVKITGTSSSASPGGAGTAAGTANANSPTLEVSSVKHISKTCKNSGMSK
jgi:ABC-type phosphate transport system substrate-binding protein